MSLVRNAWMTLGRACLEQDCLLCGAASRDEPVCEDCTRSLPRLPPGCPRCALPNPSGELCGACLGRPPAFDRTFAAWSYAYPVDRLVHALKYHARLQLAPWFARALASMPFEAPHCIVAVPLHPSRLGERGFNQAHEIARSIALAARVPLMSAAARRLRPTAVQASLSPQERLENLRDAFACSMPLRGRSILVVDDVMTTGATLDALARALKKAGAALVTNLVIARTLAPAPPDGNRVRPRGAPSIPREGPWRAALPRLPWA